MVKLIENLVFKTDGAFTSVFVENETTLNSRTYTYTNNTLELNYTYSTNSNLQGTTEFFNNVTDQIHNLILLHKTLYFIETNLLI